MCVSLTVRAVRENVPGEHASTAERVITEWLLADMLHSRECGEAQSVPTLWGRHLLKALEPSRELQADFFAYASAQVNKTWGC
jgi:hypothetical protein